MSLKGKGKFKSTREECMKMQSSLSFQGLWISCDFIQLTAKLNAHWNERGRGENALIEYLSKKKQNRRGNLFIPTAESFTRQKFFLKLKKKLAAGCSDTSSCSPQREGLVWLTHPFSMWQSPLIHYLIHAPTVCNCRKLFLGRIIKRCIFVMRLQLILLLYTTIRFWGGGQ